MSVAAIGTPHPGAVGAGGAQAGDEAEEDDAFFTEVGRFPRYPSDEVASKWLDGPLSVGSPNNEIGGLVVLSESTGRVYQFYEVAVDGGDRMGMLVRDAETFAILGGFLLPTGVDFDDFGRISNRGESPHAFGDSHLFLWAEVRSGGPHRTLVSVDEGLLEDGHQAGVDNPAPEGAFTTTRIDTDPRFAFPPAIGNTVAFQGFNYRDGKLFVLTGSHSTDSPNPPLLLSRLDAADLAQGELTVDWARHVRSCPSTFTSFSRASASGYVPILVNDESVFVPCTTSSAVRIVRIPRDSAADPDGPEEVFVGAGIPYGYVVDHDGGRVHLRVHTTRNPSLLTFDVAERAYVGQQPVGAGRPGELGLGSDGATGRVYTLSTGDHGFGLSVLDGRGVPVQPGTRFTDFELASDSPLILRRDEGRGHLFYHTPVDEPEQEIVVLADPPPGERPPPENPDRNTSDVEEEPGLTGAAFSTEARGYGIRVRVPGGVAGIPVPSEVPAAVFTNFVAGDWARCQAADREVTLGVVESVRLSNSIAGATAAAAVTDAGTQLDVSQPSRCAEPFSVGQTVNAVLGLATGNEDPADSACAAAAGACSQAGKTVDKGGQPWPFDPVSCTADEPAGSTRPEADDHPEYAALAGFEASVDCSVPGTVTASGFADPVDPAGDDGLPIGLRVASSSSVTSVVVDPERGPVVRVESLARGVGINLPGVSIEIAGMYSVAETAAKGTPGTATTTHRRMAWGVRGTGPDGEVRCDLCATEDQLAQMADGLDRAMGDRGYATLPPVRVDLAAGTPGGYQAAVQIDEFQRLSREIINGDGSFEVPALEIGILNDSSAYGTQRQIFQFAAVSANSQYGIFCLGGGTVDTDTRRCVLPPSAGGSLTVSLTDPGGTPLAGGTFTATGDDSGACTTGTGGRCTIADLPPGTYTLTETTTPAGYLGADPFPVTVSPDSVTDVNVTNLAAVGRIDITLTDADNAAPLAGGAFTITPTDPPGPALGCTTDAAGNCDLDPAADDPDEVPLGTYTVQQAASPDGYQPITDPITVVLDTPGQTAALPYTNGRTTTAPAPSPSITDATPLVTQPISSPANPVGPSLDDENNSNVLDTIGEAVTSLGDLFPWIRRSPGQAFLFASALILFGAPFWASWRRRLLIDITTNPSDEHTP